MADADKRDSGSDEAEPEKQKSGEELLAGTSAGGGESSSAPRTGPDPALGIGVFVVGLLIMATGGAATWHYVFNAGEALVLLGAIIFLLSVAITNYRQDPWDVRAIARKVIGRE